MRIYKVDNTLEVRRRSTNLDGYLSKRPCLPRPRSQRSSGRRPSTSGRRATWRYTERKSPASERLRWTSCASFFTSSTGRAAPTCARERRVWQGKTFDESLVPTVEPAAVPASVEELDALKAERDATEEAHKELERELEALRVRLAAIKAENEACPRGPRLERGQDSAAAHRSRVAASGLVAWWATRPGIQGHGDAQCAGRGIRRLRPVG